MLRRLFYEEAAEALGVPHASNMWGTEQCDDALPPLVVAQRAMDLGYPPQVVGLSTLVYCAARFLRRHGDGVEGHPADAQHPGWL